MRFEIFHEIKYEYSKPVFFDPHSFFLRPRQDEHHRLLRFEMKIDPEPALQWPLTDWFGNNPTGAWFQGVWEFMRVRVESEVEIVHPNPFDYVLEEPFLQLPARYPESAKKHLSIYLKESFPVVPAFKDFSDGVAAASEGWTTQFLTGLCRTLHSSFKKLYRPDGGPWPAAMTLERREGSCRDLTVLFIECCRVQGLAARFTSGYFCDPGIENGRPELHAWAEVYLEGAGWRGFDPTAGLVCGECHVPLASADEARQVSPVQGRFRGNDVASRMETRVQFSRTPVSF